MTTALALARAFDAYLAETRRADALAHIERDAERQVGHVFILQGAIVVRELGSAFATSNEGPKQEVREAALRRRDAERALRRSERETRPMFLSVIGRALRRAMRAGLVAAGLELDFDFGISFSLRDPDVLEYLSGRAADRVAGINETTRSRIATLLTHGTAEGWSPDFTARQIRSLYEGFSTPEPQQHIRSRAHLIAVTETGDAYEEAQLITGRRLAAAGLVMQKSWLDVEDEREEQIPCRRNGEQGWIPLEQPFASGHDRPLAHPACRCALLVRRRPRLTESALIEFDPSQPRAPKGSDIGGQWIDSGAPGIAAEEEPTKPEKPKRMRGVPRVKDPNRVTGWWDLDADAFLEANPEYAKYSRVSLEKALKSYQVMLRRGTHSLEELELEDLVPSSLRDVRWFPMTFSDRNRMGATGFVWNLKPPSGSEPLPTPPFIGVYKSDFGNAGEDFPFTVLHEIAHHAINRHPTVSGIPMWQQELVANVIAEDLLGRQRVTILGPGSVQTELGVTTRYGTNIYRITPEVRSWATMALERASGKTSEADAQGVKPEGIGLYGCEFGAVVMQVPPDAEARQTIEEPKPTR